MAICICGRTYSPKYFYLILFIGRLFLFFGSWNTTMSTFPEFVVSNIICLKMSS